MVCLGLEPGAAGWKAQTNPLSYGGIVGLKQWGFESNDLLWAVAVQVVSKMV